MIWLLHTGHCLSCLVVVQSWHTIKWLHSNSTTLAVLSIHIQHNDCSSNLLIFSCLPFRSRSSCTMRRISNMTSDSFASRGPLGLLVPKIESTSWSSRVCSSVEKLITLSVLVVVVVSVVLLLTLDFKGSSGLLAKSSQFSVIGPSCLFVLFSGSSHHGSFLTCEGLCEFVIVSGCLTSSGGAKNGISPLLLSLI